MNRPTSRAAILPTARKCFYYAAVLGVLASPYASARAAATASKQLPDGGQFAVDGGTLRIECFSDDVVRVTYAAAAELPDMKSLSVVATPAAVHWTWQDSENAYSLAGPRMKVQIDKKSGAVSFLDLANHVLLQESPQGRKIEPATQGGVKGSKCSQSFELQPDEGIYGLGQHQRGVWNYRNGGGSVRLAQANMEVGVPVITSSKGYMLLWDNPAVTSIAAGAGTVRWSSEVGKAIDYYFCYGDGTAGAAMKAYRHLTGDAPLMPRWMLGFWQCKERYASQEELLGVATRYREMKVPVDGIIQDWQYWPPGNNTWGSHKFDPARYPDPVAMFKELHDMHFHTLISVWAKFDLGSENSKELNAVGGMYSQVTRYVFPPGQGQWYDPFSTKGRETYWKQMRDQLFAKGADGWWLDAPEPEIGGMAFRTYKTGMGPGYEVYNAYPLMHSTGIYQGQRAATDEKRVVILTRSAYAGQQRNSAITWSGDIQGDWQVLPQSNPGRTQLLALRHPVLEHRHRRVLRKQFGGQRQGLQSAVPGDLLALVPVQRLLPDVPRAWLLRRESLGQGDLALRRQDPSGNAPLSRLALSPAAVPLLGRLAGDFQWRYLHAPAGDGFSQGSAGPESRRPVSLWPIDHGNANHHRRRDNALGLHSGRRRGVV